MLGIGLPIRINKRSGGGTPVPPPSFDADATAYLNAVGIINDSTLYGSIAGSAIWIAFDNWFKDTKADGLYNDILYFYPTIGTAASMHKWNAVNPLDTNAAFRLSFSGGATFSMNGVQWNGTNSYANTHLNMNLDTASTNSVAFGQYTRTDPPSGSANLDMGVYDGTNTSYLWSRWGGDGKTYVKLNGLNSSSASVINANGTGLFHAQRSSSTDVQVWRNTSKIINTTSYNSTSAINGEMYLAALNLNGSSVANYSNREACCMYMINRHLSDAEYTNWEANMLALNTALSRNV